MRGLALALLCACTVLVPTGCKHGEDLGPPSVHLRLETGLCGWQAGVDGGNGLWYEQGCENGNPKMRRAGSASKAQRSALDRAIADLPMNAETLTYEQYLPVHTAMRAMFKIPARECHASPVLVHEPGEGEAHRWMVEKCAPQPEAAP